MVESGEAQNGAVCAPLTANASSWRDRVRPPPGAGGGASHRAGANGSSLSERAVAGSGQARRITPCGALAAEHRGLSRTGRERGPGNRSLLEYAAPAGSRSQPTASIAAAYVAECGGEVPLRCFSSRACDGTSGVSVVAGSSCGWTPMDIPSLCVCMCILPF